MSELCDERQVVCNESASMKNKEKGNSDNEEVEEETDDIIHIVMNEYATAGGPEQDDNIRAIERRREEQEDVEDEEESSSSELLYDPRDKTTSTPQGDDDYVPRVSPPVFSKPLSQSQLSVPGVTKAKTIEIRLSVMTDNGDKAAVPRSFSSSSYQDMANSKPRSAQTERPSSKSMLTKVEDNKTLKTPMGTTHSTNDDSANDDNENKTSDEEGNRNRESENEHEQQDDEDDNLEYLTSLHPYPMIGPHSWPSSAEPYCEYKFCKGKEKGKIKKNQSTSNRYSSEMTIDYFMSIAPISANESQLGNDVTKEETKNRAPVIEGWMKKQGEKFIKSWKNRWCVLYEDQKLYYYVDAKPQNARGVADLSMTQSIVMVDSLKIEIITPKRIWYFECGDAKQRNSWVNAIAKVTKARVIVKKTNKDSLSP
ncbi:hypothetical protein RFI_37205 [Reticulomyxa filosa]|uniref:PH domain-containing protein n=1 Tax=Reticulomyxa filosa TaxID=46433 RepID=X6LE16_RETFI|nr:hypothetical protein RFI_37205 [Reticulomyxa filosa]|eukprot:ETO00248.1 hypothetical protein RFI_37205 [Reticulomyxa filosa]